MISDMIMTYLSYVGAATTLLAVAIPTWRFFRGFTLRRLRGRDDQARDLSDLCAHITWAPVLRREVELGGR